MLVRATSQIFEEFFVLTLGQSCHYVVGCPESFVLFDPGSSGHAFYLLKRLEDFKLPLSGLKAVFLTHPHPERVAGVWLLKKYAPHINVYATSGFERAIKSPEVLTEIESVDRSLSAPILNNPQLTLPSVSMYGEALQPARVVADSDRFEVMSDIYVRTLLGSGHTKASASFLIEPYGFLIVDEGFGYFNGSELAAPGADVDINLSIMMIDRCQQIELGGLCLPWHGVLTGDLLRRHLTNVKQNSLDLLSEVKNAKSEDIAEEYIRSSVLEAFYTTKENDHAYSYSLKRSYEAVLDQAFAGAKV